MLTPLRSALEHLQEMQSYGKGYLPGNDLNERNSDYAVKVEDTVGGTVRTHRGLVPVEHESPRSSSVANTGLKSKTRKRGPLVST